MPTPGTHRQGCRRARRVQPPMTTTRWNVSATNRMSWLIAMTVRPAAASPQPPLDARDAPCVLAGRRLVQHHDRSLHGEDRRQRQQLPTRVAEVVWVRSARSVNPTASRRRGRRPGPPSPRAPGSEARTRPRTGPCPRRSGDPGSGRRSRPAPRASDPLAGDVDAVVRTRPSVGRSRPLSWRTIVDLPLPFWPTIATRSPAAIARSTRRAPASRPDRRSPRPRGRATSCDKCPSPRRQRRVEAARGAAPAPAGSATAARRPSPPAADLRGPSRPALEGDPPASMTTTRSHRPSSRSVLCSTIATPSPVAASSRSASLTSRVPSGSSCAVGSSRTRWAGRIARSEAMTTSCRLPAGQPARLAFGSRSMPSMLSAVARRRWSRAPAARGSSARGDLLEDGSRHARQLGRRVLERRSRPASRTRAAACPFIDSPSIHRPPPVIAPPIDPGASPTRRGRAWTCPIRCRRRRPASGRR